jgi:H+/Cl- antiporter ClcA
MRITVTVVVIMFELTGALTYILPTMVCFFSCWEVGCLTFRLVDRAFGDQGRRRCPGRKRYR